MEITRKSAIKKFGALVGSAAVWGTASPTPQTRNSASRTAQASFNVRDYGAKGDGKINDTKSINKAVAAAARAGGGSVLFPSGTYLSGSVQLKSNVNLYLEQGAILEAIDNPKAYDPPEPFQGEQYQDFGHSHWHNSLIWGENLKNIGILGPGMIYGKGLLRDEAEEETQNRLGNKSIALKQCRNVQLKDFTIRHGGWFGVLATGVDNLTIDNLMIDTNRDGIDIDSCRNVRISNCSTNCTYDDAICLKSSYALGYARATQDVVITNCTISGYKEGTLLEGRFEPIKLEEDKGPIGGHGRIKFGTESNGGFKNISISNCVFNHCRGLALETVDGGNLENVTISNITMQNIINAPIFMRLGSRMRGPDGATVGELRRINISNVVVLNADNKTGVLISGVPAHSIKEIKISDVQISFEGGGKKKTKERKPPENEDHYPDPTMFGELPSYGSYLRHVAGIEVTNVNFSYADKDARPPFVLQDVKEADFRFIKAEHQAGVPVFSLQDVKNFRVFEVRSLPNTSLNNVKQKKM